MQLVKFFKKLKLFLLPCLIVFVTSYSSIVLAETALDDSKLLCSPEGLTQLIPQFKNNGTFAIPDPQKDLDRYLAAQQGLSNIIDVILTQENMKTSPREIAKVNSKPLVFGKNWLASEIGIKTDGENIVSVDKTFAAHHVRSFLTGLEPVPISKGIFYAIHEMSGPIKYPALVYPIPTLHPCINRLVLAADDTAGMWPTPTFALGKYQLDSNGNPMLDKPLIAYLIVNICLDLGTSSKIAKKPVLAPLGQIVAAFHWPCEGEECSSANEIGHKH